jgi:hypothetical protein
MDIVHFQQSQNCNSSVSHSENSPARLRDRALHVRFYVSIHNLGGRYSPFEFVRIVFTAVHLSQNSGF